MRISQ